ncbi:SDR family NAD(P)-dependent oxidoreductase [Lonepinella koalarum]|uniref:Nucleoside-diphosphate-sugar epimerase n=1 Tax=Lonepinella koalarum TaxID=53417 RepID=A0A4R1KT81_9PAST|nr:SDR family NAD(P)-dependent oxidoreductase [Lonepinella koalarum]MDH2927530.1 NAD(P)-dependent oxidoreductase [Lonepinella koalarum]TCK68328.1 nucleoside-diphosphate-sugar epimerase [Lonepinella koalarum]TFJ89584.1 SDR family NAD(P)-dependent oxidoreductase [Lonepinella koalarum]TYG35406.1 SDR family NAD(P)-dependent oxidoreductase [Lonepinella koalarum]
MRSVAIVGLGWFGLPLARDLRNLGWEVKGSKRTQEGVEEMRLWRLEAYQLQLDPEINADPDDLIALLSVDSLVVNIPPSDYFFDAESYTQGIENLVNEALLCGVKHIIFISSTSVLPMQTGQFDEETQPPFSPLYEIEQMLFTLQDIDVDIIRFGGLIGNDRHPVHSMSGRTYQQGNSPVNLVHLEDCSRAVQSLLETQGGHRLYHLVAPQHPTRVDYYQAMAEKFAEKAPHFECSEEDLQRIIVADKICRELDFVYQYPNPYTM